MRVVRIDKGGITVAPDVDSERLVVAAKAVRRVVVGDVCGLDPSAGRIEEILQRRTVFERRSPGAAREDVAVTAKALAANMDLVLVLQSLEVGVNPSRLARELIQAHQSGARPIVVLTKTDLVDPEDLEAQRSLAERFSPGTPVVATSSSTPPPEDLDAPGLNDRGRDDRGRDDRRLSELTPLLPTGSVSALLGASGAGKSTLANALAGHPVQLTREVREGDSRGRHTTTAGQMVPLADDTWLIDTPGIRGVGLWSCDEGLELAFADLSPYAQQCRFADCSHSSEPGCGLLAAVAAGEVAADRLEVWHDLISEVENLESEMETAERELRSQRNQRSRARAANQRGAPRR